MREIKFRAWEEEMRRMGYDLFVGKEHAYQNCELMQFTGLHDKNGKEIYEGDILGYWGTATWEVMWVDKKSSFRFGNYITNFPMTECVKKEIIGNIYENPELLTN